MRRVVNGPNSDALQVTGVTHAAELQDLGRSHGAGREDDLGAGADLVILSVPAVADAPRALSLEGNPADMRAGHHCQIAPPHRRAQERLGAGTALAVAGRRQIGRDPGSLAGRRVADWQLALAADLQKVASHGMKIGAVVGDRQMRCARVILRRRLQLLEMRRHIRIGPAVIAGRRPVVIVAGLAAMIDQRVDGPGAAEHLAARMVDDPPVQSRHGIGVVHPVHRFLMEQDAISDRHLNPEPAVGRPGFKQQHLMPPAGGQLLGKHAARRPAADDDVVEFPHRTLLMFSALLFGRAAYSGCS